MFLMDVLNLQAPVVVHIDATNLVCAIATIMLEKERYTKLGDIIAHTKSVGKMTFMVL